MHDKQGTREYVELEDQILPIGLKISCSTLCGHAVFSFLARFQRFCYGADATGGEARTTYHNSFVAFLCFLLVTKKLLGTSATLLETSALLVVTRSTNRSIRADILSEVIKGAGAVPTCSGVWTSDMQLGPCKCLSLSVPLGAFLVCQLCLES